MPVKQKLRTISTAELLCGPYHSTGFVYCADDWSRSRVSACRRLESSDDGINSAMGPSAQAPGKNHRSLNEIL